jgi:hypothetical protein
VDGCAGAGIVTNFASDTTKDKFGEQKVTQYVCKSLANRILPNERHYQVLEVTGCKGGPNESLTF